MKQYLKDKILILSICNVIFTVGLSFIFYINHIQYGYLISFAIWTPSQILLVYYDNKHPRQVKV